MPEVRECRRGIPELDASPFYEKTYTPQENIATAPPKIGEAEGALTSVNSNQHYDVFTQRLLLNLPTPDGILVIKL